MGTKPYSDASSQLLTNITDWDSGARGEGIQGYGH